MKNVFQHIIAVFLTLVAPIISIAQSQPWTNLGPIPFPKTVVGQIHGIGRVSQIKFHASNANKMYAASASGGLWYSANKGVNWSNLGTDMISDLQSASIAIDPNNDQTIYWGTGDANYYSSGQGVYKSTNGGSTWAASNTGMGNRLVIEMLILPTNTQTIIAATNNGIYKSTDGGTNWSLKSAATAMYDMVFKPGTNGQTVYAAAAKGFYRSTNAGDSWTQITSSAFVFGANGCRIGVSAASPNLVYVANVGAGTVGEIYSSTDGGTTFKNARTESVKLIAGYSATSSGQGNYNFDFFADQVNPSTLYLCAHVIWKSTDGGANWTQQQASWAYNLHTDQHHILKNPYNNAELWNANDGGVWSNTAEGTGAWTPKCDGIAATEVYHGYASNISTSIGYIGTQDNGGFYLSGGFWTNDKGGDDTRMGYFDYFSNCAYSEDGTNRQLYPNKSNQKLNLPYTPDKSIYSFTPANKNIAYVTEGGIVYRCSNLMATTGLAWTKIYTLPSGTVSDMQTDPGNANVLYIVANNQKAYRSDNATAATPTFTTLTLPAANNTESHIAPIKNTNIVFVSTNSTLYRSADKGVTWTNVSSGFPASTIKGLVSDFSSTKEAIYAAYSLGVYYRDNTKTSWASYANGLPIVANISELYAYNDATNPLIRVSTYGRGVWEAKMNSTINNTLPTVSITAPANNATYNAPSSVTITATAADADGTISKVAFYNGATLLGSDASSPYSYTWTNVGEGTYTITAIATDNLGGTKTSSAVTVIVSPDPTCNLASTASKYGSSPAYLNGTSTYEKAYDGDVATFFDYVGANDGFTALDFGKNKLATLTKVRFYPRTGQEARMVGGIFQGSNDSTFTTGVTNLYTVATQPAATAWAEGTITSVANFRFVRYLSPANGYCNVSEIQFCGSIATSNSLPVTNISLPLNNATYTSPATVTINATATDSDGTIAKVAFYSGATLVGTDATSPYSVSLSNVAAGTYILTTKATDNSGGSAYSSGITIVVSNPNINPTVSIMSPTNNQVVLVGTNVNITTNAADADGIVSKVEFYNGATLLGTTSNSPFNYTWNNISKGTYSITAKATDNSNAAATSSVITLVAKRDAVSSLGTPTDGQVIAYGSDINFAISTSDPDNIISKVEYFNGNTSLGQATTSPFNLSNNTLGVGDHQITVKITDQTGAIKTLSATNIIVEMTDCNGSSWLGGTTYLTGNQVEFNGEVYRAKSSNTNISPSNANSWQNIGKCAILTGNENVTLNSQANIYPNPSTNGNFHLALTNLNKKAVKYRIIDQTGKELANHHLGEIGNNHFDELIHANLADGMYYVQISIDDEIITQKLQVVSMPKALK